MTDTQNLERIGWLKARIDADHLELQALIRDAFPETRGEPKVLGRRAEVMERSGLSHQTVTSIRNGKVKVKPDSRAELDAEKRPVLSTDTERLERIEHLTKRSADDRVELFALIRAVFPELRGEGKVLGRLNEVCELTGWKREYVSRIRDGKVTA